MEEEQLNEQEIWKQMPGHPEYKISNFGNIKSFKIDRVNGKCIHPGDNGHGYKLIHLYENNHGERYYIHRLVASVFIQNNNNLPQINHKNGLKYDNRVNNLEWCTMSQNVKHSINVLGRKELHGEERPNSKLKQCQVKEIMEMLSLHIQQKLIAEKFNVSIRAISNIKTGDRWKHVKNEYKDKYTLDCGKLTKNDVIAIYLLAHLTHLNQYQIGKRFSITNYYVSQIKTGARHTNTTKHICLAEWSKEEVAKLTGDTIAVIQEHYSTPSEGEMQETIEQKAII